MVTPWRPLVDTIGVVALAASAYRASRHEVGEREERVFRALNDGPEAIHPPVWALMQSGSLAAVGFVSGHLERRGHPRAAAVTAVSGAAVWGGVKLIKPLVGRGRPQHHLGAVTVRGEEQSGLGYPSGHAAVAMTLAQVATAGCPTAGRAAAHVAALMTGAARIYVGAHLPLDVVGGLAIGTLVGGRARVWLARA